MILFVISTSPTYSAAHEEDNINIRRVDNIIVRYSTVPRVLLYCKRLKLVISTSTRSSNACI